MEALPVTRQDAVVVTYNGEDKSIDYKPHDKVKDVLERAMNAFGITNNRHLLSLFTEAGAELPDDESMEAAGVTPGEVLVLRQSTVKGGL